MEETQGKTSRRETVFEPPQDFRAKALVSDDRLYRQAREDRLAFWEKMAVEIDWFKQWDDVLDERSAPVYRWFVGGKLNVSYNCLDRHVHSHRRNKAAIIFESEDGESTTLTYYQLFREVNKFAGVLKKMGVAKGDRVVIYMPMIPEAVVAMLACTRIGAMHSVIFSGFSAEALETRITDLNAVLLITVDAARRRGKIIPLEENAYKAINNCMCIRKTLVIRKAGIQVQMKEGRDYWYDELAGDVPLFCPPEEMDAEDPLFVLYSSGTTGKPKGILHTTGGYLVGVYTTFKYIFDHRDDDIFWSTSDIGWITGQSYIVYGPLSNGATILLFEGTPDYPRKNRFWEIIEKHGVTIFYTAPTAIGTFMQWGTGWLDGKDLSSLRLLGSVGEPIKPDTWLWFHRHVGRGRCPIVDTWWQTETGMIVVTSLPGVTPMKPGCAGLPFPGVDVEVVDEKGRPVQENQAGFLVITSPWPAMCRTLLDDPQRFIKAYWERFPGYFFSGDGARKDEDGYIWILGRVDDVINVSGHRLGTAEIENALVDHEAVAEAAVIGKAHPVKGQAIVAFVTLKEGVGEEGMADKLKLHVARKIGPIARPDDIYFVPEVPKTRSGKIMRRLLRDLAEGRALGDTSTLLDSAVVLAIQEKFAKESRKTEQ